MGPSLVPSLSNAPSLKPPPTLSPIYMRPKNEVEALESAFSVYGSLFLGSFLLYIIIRKRFPLLYNYRNSVERFKTPLCEKTHGSIRWIWCIFRHSDKEIFQHYGMDGVVLIRVLRLGLKMSYIGIFNSFYLIPVYFIDCNTSNCKNMNNKNDPLAKIGLSSVDMNSNALYATTLSAYILFLSAMYFLYNEFEWFTKTRHEFLGRPRPDNYTVYVYNIPHEYRSDVALSKYFQTIFGKDDVIDTKLVRDIPILEEKVATREKALRYLERATYLQDGVDPMTSSTRVSKRDYDSVPSFELKVNQLDEEISFAISRIESRMSKEVDEFKRKRFALSKIFSEKDIIMDNSSFNHDSSKEDIFATKKDFDSPVGIMVDMKKLTVDSVKVAVKTGQQTRKVAEDFVHLVTGFKDEDGKPRAAGFVSFSRLWCKAQAIQVLHDRTPYTFQISNVPLPNYIIWENVGLSRRKINVGRFIASALWLWLCIFYSFPVAAITVASDLESLPPQSFLSFLKDASEFTKNFFALLRPLLLVLISVLVPPILKIFSKYEGHISSTALETELYSKYAVFLIIQFFYFPTLIKSVMDTGFDELSNRNVLSFITSTLGIAVPKQVGSLLEYVLVRTFLTCILELLRVTHVILSFIRRFCGPNLTENERNSTWIGFLSPLSAPRTLNYPVAMSYLMINFMCLFVFSSIAPLMSVALAFVFLLLNLTYRNQIIYTYSHENDTGGLLWVRFMKLIIYCMLVSEFTLITIIYSKKALIPAVGMLPLLLITIYFSKYFEKEHYRLTEHLPSRLCLKEDAKNREQDLSFVEGKYIQPALEKGQEILNGRNCSEYDSHYASHFCEEKRDNPENMMESKESGALPLEKKVLFRSDNDSCSVIYESGISENSALSYESEK